MMNSYMAHSTQGNYSEPFIECITLVMVALCLFGTLHALQCSGGWYLSPIDGIVCGFMGSSSLKMCADVFLRGFLRGCANRVATLVCWSIGLPAQLTVRTATRPLAGMFVKFRNGLNLLTVSTFFCYDWLRHFCSFQQICLEPVMGHMPVTGLFYYSENRANVKKNNIYLGD